MGRREKTFLEEAARYFPPDGAVYLQDMIAQTIWRDVRLLDALEEALDGWADAAQYKGDFLVERHGDAKAIARLRARLKEADDTGYG